MAGIYGTGTPDMYSHGNEKRQDYSGWQAYVPLNSKECLSLYGFDSVHKIGIGFFFLTHSGLIVKI